MKKILLLTLCVALFACTNEQMPEKGDEGQSYVPAQSVDLDRDKLEMVVGDVVELRATVNPKDATNQNIEWNSSDLTVVAVRDGEVKAIGPGRAIVTVKTEDGGYTSECVVYVSPDVQTQKKGPMTLSLRYVSATSAVLSGFIDVEQLAGYDVSGGGVGFIYAPSGTELDIDNAEKVAISSVDSENAFSKTLTGLKYDTRYVYTIFLRKNGIVQYGETQYFDTKEVIISVDQVSVTNTKATLTGKVVRLPEDSDVKVGLMYSSSNTFPSGSKSFTITPNTDGSYTQEITGLTVGTTYYYRTYLYYGGKYDYGETKEFTTNAINVNLAVSSKTATTVTFSGKMDPVSEKSSVVIGVYVNTSETVNSSNYKKMMRAFDSDIADDGTFSVTITGLSLATQYYYTPYVYSNSTYSYGEIKDFTTENIQVTLSSNSSDITATTAKITGTITALSDMDNSEIDAIGVAYSTSSSNLKTDNSTKVSATSISANTFAITLEPLTNNCKYYYCYYVMQNGKYSYGETMELTTKNVTPSVSLVASSLTATTAKIKGTVPSLSSNDKSRLEFGVAYSTSSSSLKSSSSVKESVTLLSDGTFSVSLENLTTNTKYYYCSYVKQNSSYTYGEAKEFNTVNVIPTVSVVESSITSRMATLSGMVSNLSDSDKSCLEFGVAYSTSSSSLKSSSSVKESVTLLSDGTFSVSLENLNINTKYYYCSYVKHNGYYTYGVVKEFTTSDPYSTPTDLNVASATDLSSSASANCYIVSESGLYKFKAVKGNSATSVGSVSSAAILWETFGTSTSPEMCDLISAFCYKDGYIAFKTADTFKEGNAVIAAKDASGNILWSWHIWFTDQPEEHVYYNNAGTMMDRNLGATSATPGDVCANGLLYQWGRKDPFLGSSSSGGRIRAKSTIAWPSVVKSTSSSGTIEYATANPTTFITDNNRNYDWYYTGDSSADNTRWATSETSKSIFDPCPAGWRVPDGGRNGVWSNAGFGDGAFDRTNMGISFAISSPSETWYPASGVLNRDSGHLSDVVSTYYGCYWSASPYNSDSYYAFDLYFVKGSGSSSVSPSSYGTRASGQSVRCLRESK